MKPEDFYTKPAHNEGRRLPLFLPDGTDSGEWLEVVGIDSDAFQAAMTETRRQLLASDIAISTAKAKALESGNEPADLDRITADIRRLSEDRQAVMTEREAATKAAYIKDWSFDKPCTQENALEFIINAPPVADQIDQYCSNRMNFLKKK
ncbi:hypothetical protein GCM10023116_43670 [Kistimonas scapharcae]|uniref:Tail assembly chaperone n=1 Tax=Kistimonas scapharcae TaxID=1036133 RepID=A0ABP8V751_9GAMM